MLFETDFPVLYTIGPVSAWTFTANMRAKRLPMVESRERHRSLMVVGEKEESNPSGRTDYFIYVVTTHEASEVRDCGVLMTSSCESLWDSDFQARMEEV